MKKNAHFITQYLGYAYVTADYTVYDKRTITQPTHPHTHTWKTIYMRQTKQICMSSKFHVYEYLNEFQIKRPTRYVKLGVWWGEGGGGGGGYYFTTNARVVGCTNL